MHVAPFYSLNYTCVNGVHFSLKYCRLELCPLLKPLPLYTSTSLGLIHVPDH